MEKSNDLRKAGKVASQNFKSIINWERHDTQV